MKIKIDVPEEIYNDIIEYGKIFPCDNKTVVEALKSGQKQETVYWRVIKDCSNEGIYCPACRKKVFKADFSNTMQKNKNYKFCPNCGRKVEWFNA